MRELTQNRTKSARKTTNSKSIGELESSKEKEKEDAKKAAAELNTVKR